jgi:hypothetical protein
MAEEKSFTEEIKISADKLMDTITNLVEEGNVRHVLINNSKGEKQLEFPVNVGVVGLVLAPFLAVIAALAVAAADYTIVVTRDPRPEPEPKLDL